MPRLALSRRGYLHKLSVGGAAWRGCCFVQKARWARSARYASSRIPAKNAGDWPMNRPSAINEFSEAVAAPRVAVGRMIETVGSARLGKAVGSGSGETGNGLTVKKDEPC
jgi:hypothetical protein